MAGGYLNPDIEMYLGEIERGIGVYRKIVMDCEVEFMEPDTPISPNQP
jgi:hypothetical protein